jgi:Glycosyl hydrolase family 45
MSKRLFIGLLAVALAASLSEACHPTGSVGTGTAGNGSQGTGNSSGAAGSGSAGTSGGAGTSGSAGTTGSAGSVSPTAGTTGSAGVTGSAGAGASGSAGTTGAGGIVASSEMIDNMDDGDRLIIVASGRQGPWHTFSEPAGGNLQPPVGNGFLPMSGGANNTSHAVRVTGSGYQFGGVGFDLNNANSTPEHMSSQPYNASAFTGMTFWAKGSGTLRIEFPQRSFVPTDRGGSCTGSCWNVYGATTPTLTGSWQQITISWSGMQREQGGTSPAFNPAELMGVAFKAGASFDFWIDEVAFTRSGSTGTAGTTGRGGTTGTAGRGGTTGNAGTTGTAGRGGTTGNAGTTGSAGNSGVVHPPPISGGTNGWASRYWDCCKPSCGWRANAGGRTPASSCGQQNQSLGATDERNACFDNGNAFMCWNQSPWALDDTLAYGYVAFNGVPCGRCFQIEFLGTSYNGGTNAGTSALAGKTMIVQATNIGDIGANHFDLQIPGGGVGSAGFGACMRQFGSADLGAQSGGYRTSCNGDKACIMSRCQAAFSGRTDLLAGCDWFVNWFNAADNPNLRYKQIACPSAITQRSGLADPG